MSVAVSPLRLVTPPVAPGPGRRIGTTPKTTIRTATASEAGAIHALIVEHLAEGHLLPRERGEVAVHAQRFIVAVQGDRVVACAELAPLGPTVAEVRSLVVSRGARRGGVGRRLLNELILRAGLGGYEKLCAFTHTPAYFVRMGFSIVPHTWVPEKIWTNCATCPLFRSCGQYALVTTLAA